MTFKNSKEWLRLMQYTVKAAFQMIALLLHFIPPLLSQISCHLHLNIQPRWSKIQVVYDSATKNICLRRLYICLSYFYCGRNIHGSLTATWWPVKKWRMIAPP